MKNKAAYTAKRCYPVDMRLGSFYPYFEHIAQTLVNIFEVHTVLDIGCNTGSLIMAFKNLGIEAYGVDVSQAAISSAPEELKGQLHCLDVTQDKLPFDDEKFDLVTMLDTLEHLPHFQWALCEIKRILKISGYIYMSSPSKVTETIMKATLHRNDPSHINVHSKWFWVKLFESYGLRYLYDFPKADRKKALAPLFNSKFQRLIHKVYSTPLIPDFRSDLIFQKRL